MQGASTETLCRQVESRCSDRGCEDQDRAVEGECAVEAGWGLPEYCDPCLLADLLSHARHWQAEAERLKTYARHMNECATERHHCGGCGRKGLPLMECVWCDWCRVGYPKPACTCGLLPAPPESSR